MKTISNVHIRDLWKESEDPKAPLTIMTRARIGDRDEKPVWIRIDLKVDGTDRSIEIAPCRSLFEATKQLLDLAHTQRI